MQSVGAFAGSSFAVLASLRVRSMSATSKARRRVAKRATSDPASDVGKVWAAVTSLAQKPGMIDLGKDSMRDARKAASDVICHSNDAKANQYSPIPGRPELITSIVSFYKRTHDVELDPTEVVVSTSGTEAIYAAVHATVDPGDEVIVFEPFFPWYQPHIKLAGGVCKAITLHPPSFELDSNTLQRVEAAISDKTKLLIFNSPHNPSGHVASAAELAALAAICRRHPQLLVIADEVYEGCVFPSAAGGGHLRLAQQEGMRERTITIGSASKLFSLCGWRVGWATGPADLIAATRSMHGYTTYCAPTPLMLGVAAVFDVEDGSFGGVPSLFQGNYDMLRRTLEDCGLAVCDAQGGYFLLADVSRTGLGDLDFVHWLAEHARVIAVPLQVFYVNTPAKCTLVRFSICKSREIMEQACDALRSSRSSFRKLVEEHSRSESQGK